MNRETRHAVRALAKSPGFSAAVVLTLSLGIGANTAVFSVVNAILLRPLPFEDPERLALVHESRPRIGSERSSSSEANYFGWRERCRSLERISAFNLHFFTLTGVESPEEIQGAIVSADFFPLLGVKPYAGRTFSADEDRPGNNQVVLLSYELWQRQFGSDPGVIGRKLILNEKSFSVIGIMPPRFSFPPVGQAGLWAPISLDASPPEQFAGRWYLRVLARLKPGVTFEKAQAELSAVSSGLEHQYPEANAGFRAHLAYLHGELVRSVRTSVLLLWGAVGFVLLIACANVANLLLARAAQRKREIAIRIALGAGPWHRVSQLLSETVVLALSGGAIGVLFAWWGVDLLTRLGLDAVPSSSEIGVDVRVLVFTLGISLITGVILALFPAWNARKPDIQDALREGGSRSRNESGLSRARWILIVSELALSLVLLTGAGLMLESLRRLSATDPGFETGNILTMSLSHPRARFGPLERRADFFAQLLDRIEQMPGVRAAGAVNALPLSGRDSSSSFVIEGRPAQPHGRFISAQIRIITSGYLRAMGIPVVAGRGFTRSDAASAPRVAIINRAMSRWQFRGENPLGRRLAFDTSGPFLEIVGVVGDVRHERLNVEPVPEIYLPHAQSPLASMMLAVRTTGNPSTLTPAIRGEVHTLDKDQPVTDVATLDERLERSISRSRFDAVVLGLFAALACVLAVVGVYGLVSYSVAQRTYEFGVRLALGADKRGVVWAALREGFGLTVAGIGIGLVGAIALTSVLSSLLYSVRPRDPVVLSAACLLLATTSLVATWLPARRAAKVDPMKALRYE